MKSTSYAAVAIIVIVAVAALVAGLYLTNSPASAPSTKLQVIATFYPLYDFVINVGGDRIDASILVPETVDVHDFDPTPADILKIANADVIVYNGGGLEPWISQVITTSANAHLVQVDSSQGIAMVSVPPQFQSSNQTLDPHFWLSPVMAKQQINNILNGLIQADPADGSYFTQNAQIYMAKLDELNSQIVNGTTNTKTRYFVTFHEAFVYFANQYNLTQIPIAGPFQEEPTAADIQNVINAINQYHLRYVGYESLENPQISQRVSTETNATLILMNPIEGLTAEEKAAGKDYIALMKDNLLVFELALNNVGS